MQALQTRMLSSPEEEWEILSIADQLYRRGKLPADAYARIKVCVGAGRRAAQSLSPIEAPSAPPSAPAAAPVAAEPGGSALAVLRDRYRLVRVIGRGDAATVFEARDRYLVGTVPEGEPIAVRLLDAEPALGPHKLQAALAAFERLRSLAHPNIIRVHDVDRDGDRTFFTMELLVGSRLSDALETNPARFQSGAYARRLIQAVGAAIVHAHSHGVQHGKLDAHRIFLCDDGGIRVRGFCAEPADERDDLHALAVIAYRLFCGRYPPEGSAPDRPAGLGDAQWAALRAGLARDRFARPADVGAWLRTLDAPEVPGEAGVPPVPPAPPTGAPAARPPWRSTLVAIGVLLVLFGAWQILTRSAPHGAAPTLAAPAAVPEPPPPVSPQVPAERTAAEPAAAEPAAPESAAPSSPPPLPALPALPAPEWAGNVRVEFQTSDINVAPDEVYATVVVRRHGGTRGKAGFTWWTESGTAKPGTDFESVGRRMETIADGRTAVSLLIPIVRRAAPSPPRSFYVFIDEPSPGALLGAKTVAIVTIDAANPP